MKHLYILLCLSLTIATSAFCQTQVRLDIHHTLREADFAIDLPTTNNRGNDLKFSRVEYYISTISLTHDGGQETLMEDLYILVDASKPTVVDLGDHDISQVEKIEFHVGVDQSKNHLDPTIYPSSHPLAPKSPSMHWGWSAGYRFVALEGFGGTALNQLFQLHGLGDSNYFTTEIDLDLKAVDNELTIELNADYTKALENIEVNSGLIVHGSTFEASTCLRNFKNLVFTSNNITTSIIEHVDIASYNVHPNPTVDRVINFHAPTLDPLQTHRLVVTSIDGKLLKQIYEVKENTEIDLSGFSTGTYFIKLLRDNQLVITKRIILN